MPTQYYPLYLFLGEEDFLKEDAIEDLKSRFLDSRTKDLNYSVFYAREKDFDAKEMLGSLNTSPFLSKKRMVVLKGADSLPTPFKQSVLLYAQNPKDTSIFVIESASSAIKGDFLLQLSKLAHLVYCRRLTDSGVTTWLIKKAASYGKGISSDAIYAIRENLPNDLRMLSSNMDNIILYIGKRDSITRQDVETVIGEACSLTASNLIDTIEQKDAKKALQIFSFLKRDRKKQTELLGLLAWNARMILRVKELSRIKNRSETRKELGLYPRQFDQIMRQASGFTQSDILTLLKEILKADVDIKTGGLPRTVMERLVVKMCS